MFTSLVNLNPYLFNESAFKEKTNQEKIKNNIADLNKYFIEAGHDSLLKHDLFAPSYQLALQSLQESQKAFENNRKEHARWLLKETISLCLDCHTRLPTTHASGFQAADVVLDKDPASTFYDIGISYLIVRKYADAEEQFNQSIQQKLSKKDFDKIILPFQQILLIETKIKKDPKKMISVIEGYLKIKPLPEVLVEELKTWKQRLALWQGEKSLSKINNEDELKSFINRRLLPLKNDSFADSHKVDYLFSSGILSNYFFKNQKTTMATEINYWVGWLEKRLKREEFLSSGDLFLKQCMKKYHKHPIARECLSEYEESLQFDFTGSSGTHIPRDLQQELDLMIKEIEPKK
jgi:hypothetical protein